VFGSSRHPVSTYGVTKPIPVGEEWVTLLASMRNGSDLPVTLESVDVSGEGLGTVVDVLSIRIAPRQSEGGTVPGGTYSTYPPAWVEGGRCIAVDPQRVRGRMIRPGGYPRIMLHLRATRPGSFRISEYVVRYRQGLRVFEERLPQRFRGKVAAAAEEQFTPYPEERRCVPDEGRILS
jgi:hypothetical protein